MKDGGLMIYFLKYFNIFWLRHHSQASLVSVGFFSGGSFKIPKTTSKKRGNLKKKNHFFKNDYAFTSTCAEEYKHKNLFKANSQGRTIRSTHNPHRIKQPRATRTLHRCSTEVCCTCHYNISFILKLARPPSCGAFGIYVSIRLRDYNM